MSKGLSFAGLMDLGTLDALKVAADKASSQTKEEVKPIEHIQQETKETAIPVMNTPAHAGNKQIQISQITTT